MDGVDDKSDSLNYNSNEESKEENQEGLKL